MIVGPDDVDAPGVFSPCLVNDYPRLVTEHLLWSRLKDAHREAEGPAIIGRFQDGDTALPVINMQDRRVDLVMGTEGETRVGGTGAGIKAGKDSPIDPGAATIELADVTNLEAIVGNTGEEFGTTDKVLRVVWVLGHHGFTVRLVDVMADANVGIRRLGRMAEGNASSLSWESIQRRRHGMQRAGDGIA